MQLVRLMQNGADIDDNNEKKNSLGHSGRRLRHRCGGGVAPQLRIIGNGPRHRIPHDDQDLRVGIHGAHSFGHLFRMCIYARPDCRPRGLGGQRLGTLSTHNKTTHLRHHKVAGTLFDGDLAAKRERHLFPIPFQAHVVVFVAIEKVHLAGGLLDARMQVQHLEQGARAGLTDAHDQHLRQAAARLRESMRMVEQCATSSLLLLGGVVVVGDQRVWPMRWH